MPCFILCMYVKWEWKHLNTGSMALLRIKSTFLQTEEFVCSRLVQSPHSFTNRGAGFCMWNFGKDSESWDRDLMRMGFFFLIVKECSYLFIAEAVDLGWILWISKLNSLV